jgi:hypothetical protein
VGRDHSAYAAVARTVTTAGLGLDESASCHLALVSCEGGEDFFLLASRHFDEVQRAAEFRSDLVKFLWRDTEVPMRLLEVTPITHAPNDATAGPWREERCCAETSSVTSVFV